MRFLRRKTHKIFLGLILLLIVANSFVTVQKKASFYIDEVSTFWDSNHYLMSFMEYAGLLFHKEKQQTLKDYFCETYKEGEFIKELYVSEGYGFNYCSVLYSQTFVDSHPPLHHLVLHTVSSISRSSNLIMMGYSLNIVFLLMSCLLIYRIVRQETKNCWLGLSAVAFYGFSYEFLNTVVFFRMYAMQAFWFSLIFYLYVQLRNQGWHLVNKKLWQICIVQALTLLTHYFSLFYVVPFIAISAYCMRGEPKMQKKYIIANVVMLTITFCCLWPQAITAHLSRAIALETTVPYVSVFKRFIVYASHLDYSFFAGVRIVFILFFSSLFIYCCKEKSKRDGWGQYLKDELISKIIFLPIIIYYFVVVLVAPYLDSRYQMPVMPIVSIMIVLSLWSMLMRFDTKKRYISLVCYIVFVSVVWQFFIPLKYLYESTPKKRNFVENYEKLPSVILDKDFCSLYIEILANYNHPISFRSDESHAVPFLQDNLEENKYVVYLSKCASIETLNRLQKELNFTKEKIDYETDFYEVYLMTR